MKEKDIFRHILSYQGQHDGIVIIVNSRLLVMENLKLIASTQIMSPHSFMNKISIVSLLNRASIILNIIYQGNQSIWNMISTQIE